MAVVVATNAYREEQAARAVSGAASLVPYKVAFGDGTTLEGIEDIALENELFRVDPDDVSSDGTILTVTVEIDYSDTGDSPISEIGIYADNGGTDLLMGRKVFTPKTFTAPDRSVFTAAFSY